MNFNEVRFAGYLARDPELRYTPKGTAVCQLTVATNRSWRDDSGTEKSEVTFIDFTAWQKTAEVICQYFRKGMPIFICGRLKVDQWEDKQTQQKRSKVSVVLESFQFVGPAQNRAADESAPPTRPPPRNAPASQSAPGMPHPVLHGDAPPIDDDDVPF